MTCQHAPCTCAVDEPGGFCSLTCQDAADKDTCTCPHPDCGGHGVPKVTDA